MNTGENILRDAAISVDEIGALPAKRAIILWGTGDRAKAADWPSGMGKIGVVHVGIHCEVPAWTKALQSSRGACDANWLDGSHWMNCPMGIFLWIDAVEGFTDKETKIRALWQFAKISGQGWAVDLLRELGADMSPVDGQPI